MVCLHFKRERESALKKREVVCLCREEEVIIMIGNYLSTFGVCVFAYLYPLFLCFKVVVVCALFSLAFALCLNGVVVFRCVEISRLIPSMSPRFFPYSNTKRKISKPLRFPEEDKTPPDQKSSRILLLLLHHYRRSKCTKSRPKSSADGASIGSSWPRLPCLNASRMPFCSSCPCTTRRKSRSSCTCGTQNRKARCTSTINSSDQRCRNTKDRSIEKSKTCKRNLETGASRTRGWRTRTYRR